MKEACNKSYVIITDLDGTLTDSDSRLEHIFKKMMTEFGYEKSIHTALAGMAEDMEPGTIMKDTHIDVEIRAKMEIMLKEMISREKFSLRPYARQALISLWKSGFELALVTHNYYEPALKFLTENGISSLFNNELIISHDNFPERKPSKRIIEEILSKSGRESAIIIGNNDSDIRFGMNSDSPVIFFGDATSSKLANSYKKLYRCNKWARVPSLVKRITNGSV